MRTTTSRSDTSRHRHLRHQTGPLPYIRFADETLRLEKSDAASQHLEQCRDEQRHEGWNEAFHYGL